MNEQEDLLRFDFKQKYVIWDFETISLNLVHNKPWQLGFSIAQGKKILENYDILIHWDTLEISDMIAKMTGFNKKKYKKEAIPKKEALEIFRKYIYDPEYINIGHNILGYDVYMLNILNKEVYGESDYSFIERSFDTLSIEKGIKQDDKPPSKDKVLEWMLKYTSFFKRGQKNSITALCKQYEIDFDPDKLHDASYDVSKNFEIFWKQLWKIDI